MQLAELGERDMLSYIVVLLLEFRLEMQPRSAPILSETDRPALFPFSRLLDRPEDHLTD